MPWITKKMNWVCAVSPSHRKPSYAISVSAPKDRMDDARMEQFTHLILDTKQRIQNELGN